MEQTVDNTEASSFEEDNYPRPPHASAEDSDVLYLDLGAFEGPIDLLLTLSQEQKVDLAQISILTLVDQYIEFIEKMKKLQIVVAADYLVMAAWLAYLKSRLLLPKDETDDEPSGEAMADALTFQLKRLEAIRKTSEKLFGLPRKGMDFYARGNPEGLIIDRKSVFKTELYDLLSAYGDMARRKEFSSYNPEAYRLVSIDEALERLEQMLGKMATKVWAKLMDLLPDPDRKDALYYRSNIASTFIASLEVAKRGRIALRQDSAFGDIYLKVKEEEEND